MVHEKWPLDTRANQSKLVGQPQATPDFAIDLLARKAPPKPETSSFRKRSDFSPITVIVSLFFGKTAPEEINE